MILGGYSDEMSLFGDDSQFFQDGLPEIQKCEYFIDELHDVRFVN